MFAHFSHTRAPETAAGGESVSDQMPSAPKRGMEPALGGAAEAPRPTAAEQVELKMKTDK